MKTTIFACLLCCLLQCSANLLKRGVSRSYSPFCQSHPKPTVETEDILQALKSSFAEAEKRIEAALSTERAPGGAAVSFVYKNAMIWNKGFGLIDMKNPGRGPPNENTGFRIGSITKILTSLLTLVLRDEGFLSSLDDDITKYLKEFSVKNPFATNRGITFRQLMSHMSGLPRESPCEDIFEKGCFLTDEQIYKNLAEFELLNPPGTQPLYSNLGFGLLGRTLEKVHPPNKWDEALIQMVFDPLGIVNSGNNYTDKDIQKLALGYYKDGSEAKFIDIGWESPAGQTYSTVSDLAKVMMLVFSDDKPANASTGQIVDGESLREWLEPAYLYPDTTGFSYPWELLTVGNYTAHTKDGRINGYTSKLEMVNEIKTGFVLLQSCDDCLSHYDIIGIMESLILETDKQLQRLQPPPEAPNNIAAYTGTFSAIIGGIKSTWNINQTTLYGGPILTMQTGSGQPAYLEWRGGDSFQVSLDGHSGVFSCHILQAGHIGERVYFQREGSDIVSLTRPGSVYGKVYKRDSN